MFLDYSLKLWEDLGDSFQIQGYQQVPAICEDKAAPPVCAYMTIHFKTIFQCVYLYVHTYRGMSLKIRGQLWDKLAVCGIGRLRLPVSHSECLDLLNHLGGPIIPFFKNLFQFFICLFFVGRNVLPACQCVCHMGAWCLKNSEEGIRSLGTEVTNDRKPPRECWQLNLDLPPKQQVLLTSEFSLQQPPPSNILVSCFS